MKRAPSILPYLRQHKRRALSVSIPAPDHAIDAIPNANVRPPPFPTNVHHPHQVTDSTSPNHDVPQQPKTLLPPNRAENESHGDFKATNIFSKPRKRFRRKVTGLFGDHTDLKKRMKKLCIETNVSDILKTKCEKISAPETFQKSLPATDGIIQLLTESSQSPEMKSHPVDKDALAPKDSFDFVQLTQNAVGKMGSMEKLSELRKYMGTLSPQSNENFLSFLKLGTRPVFVQERIKVLRKDVSPTIVPLSKPFPDPTGEFQCEEKNGSWTLPSLESVDRSAFPALFRCKVRRHDRGYRHEDVLRARLHGVEDVVATQLNLAEKDILVHGNIDDNSKGLDSPSQQKICLELTCDDNQKSKSPKALFDMKIRQERISSLRSNDRLFKSSRLKSKKRRHNDEVADDTDTDEVESGHDEFQYRVINGGPEHADRVRQSKRFRTRPRLAKEQESHYAFEILVEAAASRTEVDNNSEANDLDSSEQRGVSKKFSNETSLIDRKHDFSKRKRSSKLNL